MNKKQKIKVIIQAVLSVIFLAVAVYLMYNNFIKKDDSFSSLPAPAAEEIFFNDGYLDTSADNQDLVSDYEGDINNQNLEYNFNQADVLNNKISLDIFDSQIFKSLIDAKRVVMPSNDRIGRNNPFIKY